MTCALPTSNVSPPPGSTSEIDGSDDGIDRSHTELPWVDARSGGDHRLYIGRVLRAQSQPVPPLVFHGGHYHLLGEVL